MAFKIGAFNRIPGIVRVLLLAITLPLACASGDREDEISESGKAGEGGGRSIVAAGDLTGHAWDLGTGSGGALDGIAGVRVQAIPSGGPAREALTNSEGQYTITDLPAGNAKVEFSRNGYLRRPTVVDTQITQGALAQADAELLQAAARETRYYDRAGENVAQKAGRRPETYRAQWAMLQDLPLAPQSKVVISRAIARSDPRAARIAPEMQPYISADPDAVGRLSQDVRNALEGPAGKIPRPETVKGVPREIAAEIVAHEAQGAKSDRTRKEFINRFKDSWGGDFTEKVNHKIGKRQRGMR